MCLANPAKVLEILKPEKSGIRYANVAYLLDSIKQEKQVTSNVCISLVEGQNDREVKVGDYLLIHVGMALQFYEEDAVSEILKAFGYKMEDYDV